MADLRLEEDFPAFFMCLVRFEKATRVVKRDKIVEYSPIPVFYERSCCQSTLN